MTTTVRLTEYPLSPNGASVQPSTNLPFNSPPSPAVTEKSYSGSVGSYAKSGTTAAPTAGEEHDVDEGRPRKYPLPPPSVRNQVLLEDLKTPDRHVERDPRLIRLTGVHPFNVEAPLSDLFNEGFLTTKDLHYVRNHGAVPQVEDSECLDWTFSIEGMVEHAVTMTLRNLLAEFEQYTYPITLVCAGNRRKEQNIVRKTNGFSWGAAGLSTALWTGVPLGHILDLARPKRGARFVCLEGADKLPNGYYGTSLKLAWARDAERGILVAHKMNGEPLSPDHGKPLRVVVPGQIGGRSVKWLKRIIVTAEPSANWYHIYDNRVLPTAISPEESGDLPDVWRDERYAIYDLNTNSAIAFPAHQERLQVTDNTSSSYKVRGYAYTGGGKRVTRVELTLDQGKSWLLANVEYPEDAYRDTDLGERLYGGRIDHVAERESSFCWCFWSLDISVEDLQRASDMMVRCMDDAMMVQPRDMYWSVLGMMNNPWFRVVIHIEDNEDGGKTLRFEHPAPPRQAEKGWMDRVKKEGGDLNNGFWGARLATGTGQDGKTSTTAAEGPGLAAVRKEEVCMIHEQKLNQVVTLDELKQHENNEAPWFVVNGQVYDGTKFLEGHPGGAASITGAAGRDITGEFMAIHSENATAMMPDYHVGALDKAALEKLYDREAAKPSVEQALRPVFLQAQAWSKAVLTAKTPVSPDSKIFSFRMENAHQRLGLPVGQHVIMRLRDPANYQDIQRAYTPLSVDIEVNGLCEPACGTIDVLVKIYLDAPARPGGRMTQALDALPLGHTVEFKGPIGHFQYLGGGVCVVGPARRTVRRFIMVCGGSGITPVFQVLRAVLAADRRTDPTQCLLLDGNRTEADILCHAELDALATAHRDRCRVVHVLSQAGDDWTGLRGRMDQDFIQREVGKRWGSGHDTAAAGELVLVCGPESLQKSVRRMFGHLGWREEDLHFF